MIPRRMRRPLYFTLALGFFTALYAIYKEDVYIWFCENEGNAASCTVVGMINEKNKYLDSARFYYQKSCNGEYALGCFHLGEVQALLGDKEASALSHKSACSMGHVSSCR